MSEAAAHAKCENCQTTLLGPHCHACGQSAHNPLKHLGHAIEDVFESFWHLDGRVFRSLRDTCIPGRIINAYLAGHRIRYLPPLRLFVILSLFTFFLAQISLRLDAPNLNIRTKSAAPSVAAQTSPDTSPLRDLHINGRPWHPDSNPLQLQGVSPGFNRWFNHALMPRLQRNVRAVLDNPQHLSDAWISSIPSALFFLVPVFALLLRLAHPRSGMGYLEHMVVALYSHSFILISATGLMLLGLLAQAGGLAWLAQLSQGANLVGLIALCLWLFVCQQRVYRQSWPITAIKFGLIGSVYALLVLAGALLTLFAVFLK